MKIDDKASVVKTKDKQCKITKAKIDNIALKFLRSEIEYRDKDLKSEK